MHCPECDEKYDKEVCECPKCGVSFGQELNAQDYKEIITLINPMEISLIKSILDGEGIDYYIKGEQITFLAPLPEPARLMVAEDQAVDALEIMKDLKIVLP